MEQNKVEEVRKTTSEERTPKKESLVPDKKATFFNTVPRTITMMKLFLRGEYKVIPAATLIGIGLWILYLVLPADFVPDVVPFVGYLDDAAMAAILLSLCQRDLSAFEIWADEQQNKKDDTAEKTVDH